MRAIDWASMRRFAPLALATWFIVISALRLAVIAHTPLGFDGRLYRMATASWMSGGDPWRVSLDGVFYAAPPPSLLPVIPLVWLPENVAIGALVSGCVVANLFAIRRLGLPWWWIAFPPLVDGIWNGNVHVLVVPLLVAGFAPVATMLKIYALPVPVLLAQKRATLLSVGLLAITVPILPWPQFIAELPAILGQLRTQSSGGLSVTAFPPLIAGVLAILAAFGFVIVGRKKAAWLVVPVLWPSTQWYYSSMAMPGVTALAAAVLAVPLVGGPFLALTVLVVEVMWKGRGSELRDRIRRTFAPRLDSRSG